MAPVVEEFIFRGFIGYRLERYGKVFTILFTALIFSLFHANITQEVFTFMAGIVFAYVAIEYGFQWAVVVHMMNNFIFAVVVDIYVAQNDEFRRLFYCTTIRFSRIYHLGARTYFEMERY